jgi:hypothetical protein
MNDSMNGTLRRHGVRGLAAIPFNLAGFLDPEMIKERLACEEESP